MVVRIADAHSDFLAWSVVKNNPGLYDHAGLSRLKKGGVALQTFAVWVPPETPDPVACGCAQMDYFHTYAHTNGLVACTRPDHLTGKAIKAVLAIEGGEAVGCDNTLIPFAYSKGVRMMSLTWNNENDYASGSAAAGGLKPRGREAVRLFDELGIAFDLSHINEQGFWEALELSTRPPCASHTCVHALCASPRNLRREQIDALIARGGYIGINFYPHFLRGENRAAISDVLDHIDYILDRGGEDAVGFGSDFCGIGCTPEGLSTAADFQKLPEAMLSRGWPDTLVLKICYGNFSAFILEFLQ